MVSVVPKYSEVNLQLVDYDTLKKIYKGSVSFHLDESIVGLTNDSSLASDTMRFIGMLMQEYNPKTVLEFGSGVSTLFLSSILDRLGAGKLYSIEHSKRYYLETLSRLEGIHNAKCILSPVTPYRFKLKSFLSYGTSYLKKLPKDLRLDLVIIDGPPGFRFGREAPLYQIAPFLTDRSLILLDDANRPPEQEAIFWWHRVWRSRIKVSLFPRLKKGLAVIQIKDPDKIAIWPFGLREIWKSYFATRRAIRREKKSGQDDSPGLSFQSSPRG